jgi:hypothetical protein
VGPPFGEKLRREIEKMFPDFPTAPPSIRATVFVNV